MCKEQDWGGSPRLRGWHEQRKELDELVNSGRWVKLEWGVSWPGHRRLCKPPVRLAFLWWEWRDNEELMQWVVCINFHFRKIFLAALWSQEGKG